ncbi:MAG: TatD family deoxyribonuclease [Ruminococcaceae bacterium]|nr:TatD family deoxyribonuclease [Oscillospiraceae bacterium]
MLYDSHAHYDDSRFDADRDEMIMKAHREGVAFINNIASSIESSKKSIALAEKFDFVYATVGVHPSDVMGMTDNDIEILRDLAKHKKVVAIGEIGLDYHYDDTSEEEQRMWFPPQLELSRELSLPVVIHDRESRGDCIRILKEHNIENGVVHCFSGSAETAKEILKMGLHISFTGVLTFKNARKAIEALKVIPMDRLMIETDCPYMSPEPYRGKRNYSGYVIKVAEKIAEIKGLSVEEVAMQTTKTAKKFFNI